MGSPNPPPAPVSCRPGPEGPTCWAAMGPGTVFFPTWSQAPCLSRQAYPGKSLTFCNSGYCLSRGLRVASPILGEAGKDVPEPPHSAVPD